MQHIWPTTILSLAILLFASLLPLPANADQEGEMTALTTESGPPAQDEAAGRHEHGRLSDAIRAEVMASINRAIDENPDLSDEAKARIKSRFENGRYFNFWRGNWGGGPGDSDELRMPQFWIAMLSIFLIFGTPVMIVVALLYAGHRKRRIAHETASQFLASGQPVPPEVWQGLAGNTSPRSNLHKGMVMLGIGIGILLSFGLMGNMTIAYLGLIPLLIGIALLLIWKLERE